MVTIPISHKLNVFQTALSGTAPSITQLCPGQRPVSLSAVPDCAQSHSALSRTASSYIFKYFRKFVKAFQNELAFNNGKKYSLKILWHCTFSN